eukprot:3742581-Prymnesium_polylepis.3
MEAAGLGEQLGCADCSGRRAAQPLSRRVRPVCRLPCGRKLLGAAVLCCRGLLERSRRHRDAGAPGLPSSTSEAAAAIPPALW